VKLISIAEAAKIVWLPEKVLEDFLRTGFRNAPSVYFFDAIKRVDEDEIKIWAQYMKETNVNTDGT